MTYDTLAQLIKAYMQTPQPEYIFCWQGGEPMLMGDKFFHNVIELQLKYSRHARVLNALQTNATLITEGFAKYLAQHKFLVGVSLDGPPSIHDRYRRYKKQIGSHADTMRGIEYLTRYNADLNILTLVSNANVRKGKEIYTYFRDRGFFYHQYIPCVEFDRNDRPRPYTITAEQWGVFLCDIFDEWFASDTRRVSVRLFDAIINYLVLNIKSSCQMGKDCRKYFVIEFNGDVYPCDFFVEPGLKLGNIYSASWNQLAHSKTYLNFGKDKSKWHSKCEACKHLAYCAGDCVRHRFHESKNPAKLSWLCKGLKRFYDHAMPSFIGLAEEVSLRPLSGWH